jgi:hypothetical protein
MHVFVFQTQRRNSTKVGFTTWRSGANLPVEPAPWSMVSQGAMHTGDPLIGVPGGADTVLIGIERDGFFIAQPELRHVHQAGRG